MGFRDAELSIVICDDAAIRELNRTYRQKDKATDVLSFPQMEAGAIDRAARGVVLGDVVISLETARAQAGRAGVSLEEEVVRLLVHGVLHLLGHDHVHGGWQARKMRLEEERLLKLLGG